MNQRHDAAAQLTLSVLRNACNLETPRNEVATKVTITGEETLSNTLSSLVTMLSAIVLVTRDGTSSDNNHQTIGSPAWLIHSAAIDLITSWKKLTGCKVTRSELNEKRLRRCLQVLVAELLLQISMSPRNLDTTAFAVDECAGVLRDMASVYVQDANSEAADDLPEIVCSIARCCGRTASSDGLAQLELLVQKLVSYSSPDLRSSSASFLRQLALDSACCFASDSDADAASQALLRRVEASVQSIGPLQTTATPFRKRGQSQQTSRDGYRWEEGICEWVLATPAGWANHCRAKRNMFWRDLQAHALCDHTLRFLEDKDAQTDASEPKGVTLRAGSRNSSTLSSSTHPSVGDGRLDVDFRHKSNSNSTKSLARDSEDEDRTDPPQIRKNDETSDMKSSGHSNEDDVEDELSECVTAVQMLNVPNYESTEQLERYRKRRAREQLRARRQVQVQQLCKVGNDVESDDELCSV
ncbi:MAG: hypothetical protein M1822_006779 [Bathelium mastoideum]|nr:MAG: hypothetical protein M1822_006779 [Bathelium mastoideum]